MKIRDKRTGKEINVKPSTFESLKSKSDNYEEVDPAPQPKIKKVRVKKEVEIKDLTQSEDDNPKTESDE